MNDKEIMENILLTTKGVCDLYLHGSVESSTPQVHDAFTAALNDAICMQNGLYQQMESHGWYQKEQEQPQKLQQLKQKYASAQG
ncbi:MAG: spore coat protein [Oscillospiraceae bacterium]|nr:spore coat protein [Oscillospiraceae bacterium]